MFVVLEGMDGVGKTTQAGLLADWWRSKGKEVFEARDPGGTDLGELLRGLVKAPAKAGVPLMAETQLLLFAAARLELAREIRFKRLSNHWVVCDRWALSSWVYQGEMRGLDRRLIGRLESLSAEFARPDLTLVLDVSPAALRERLTARPADDWDRQALHNTESLRNAYLREARGHSACRTVNAGRPAEEVHEQIRQAILHHQSSGEDGRRTVAERLEGEV